MPKPPNLKTAMALPRQSILESRLAYHLRCLQEDVTDPKLPRVERPALVQDRARKLREIRQELAAAAEAPRRTARHHP